MKLLKLLCLALSVALMASLAVGCTTGTSGTAEIEGGQSIFDDIENTINGLGEDIGGTIGGVIDDINQGLSDAIGQSSGDGSFALAKDCYTLKDYVVIDTADYYFLIKDVSVDDYYGINFNIYLENKTSATNVYFKLDNAYLNHYLGDLGYSLSVDAGKKLNETMHFDAEDLEKIGLDRVDELRFSVSVWDADDWLADPFIEQDVVVYPTGKDASSIVVPERASADSDTVIVSDGNFKFICLGVVYDDFWDDYYLDFYCENNSDSTMYFIGDEFSLNSYMIMGYLSVILQPGMRGYGQMGIWDSDMTDTGSTSVDEVRFLYKIADYDDYYSDTPAASGYVSVYGAGKNASNVQYPARRTGERETVLYDNDQFTVIMIDTEVDDFWGFMCNYYIENKTDKPLYFSFEDISVNDFMCDTWDSESVSGHQKLYGEFHFSDEFLKENQIAVVDKVEGTFKVTEDSWYMDSIFSETFSYNP